MVWVGAGIVVFVGLVLAGNWGNALEGTKVLGEGGSFGVAGR